MKIKKLFSMFVAAFFVLAIAGVAGAADPCSSCKELAPGNIYLGGGQDTCHYFNYERRGGAGSSFIDEEYVCPGYCLNHTASRVIFDICACPDTTANFASGQIIGIRQTILVNGQEGQNGVYWTNYSAGSENTVRLNLLADKATACGVDGYDREFGDVDYYLANGTLGTPNWAGSKECSVPADHKVVMLSSGPSDGYPVSSSDEANQLHMWWIDIPAMVYDLSEVTPGDVVTIKIELLNKDVAGICAECVSICECTVDVGTMGCKVEAITKCIYFPYVLQQEEGWYSGIAITNLGFLGAAWTPTITFIDAAGAEFVATPTYNKGTVAFLMDDVTSSA